MSETTAYRVRGPRRSRQQLLSGVPPCNTWKCPDAHFLQRLNPTQFNVYTDNRKTVELYSEGKTADEISTCTGLTISEARRLFDRCIRPDDSGELSGFWECLPSEVRPKRRQHHVRDPERTPFDPELTSKGRGLKGILQVVFTRHPEIKRGMDDLFATRRVGTAAPVPVITPKLVLQTFHDLCRKAGIRDDQWPFEPARKGEDAIRNYWNQWKSEHARKAVENSLGEDAAKMLSIDQACVRGADEMPRSRPDAYARVEVDEHSLHWISQVVFPTRHGHDLPIQMRRHWALLAREKREGPILASTLSYREKYDTNDLLRLARRCVLPPERLKLTLDGLSYAEGAAYPGELPSFRGNLFQVLALDADSSHISLADRGVIETIFSCDVVSERVGQATARNSIEGLYAKLAKAAREMPSSTGSGPNDPARRGPEQAAKQWSIHARDEHQILDVWCRNENARVLRATGMSALDGLEQALLKHEAYINPLGDLAPSRLYQLLPRYKCTLTLSRGKYGCLGVNLMGARYSSKELIGNRELKSTSQWAATIFVEEDARYAFVVPDAFPNLVFGVVVQDSKLRAFPHPLEWRRLTEAAAQNAGRAYEAATPSTMLQVRESLGQRALEKDREAIQAISGIEGFSAELQTGSVGYVMSKEDRQTLDLDDIPDEQDLAASSVPAKGKETRSEEAAASKATPGLSHILAPSNFDPFGLGAA